MVRQVRQLRAAAELARNRRRESHLLDKTRICRFFARGLCTRGEACSFAHGSEQLHTQPDLFRTELCFDFARSGTCRAGAECNFAHTADELRPLSIPGVDGTPSVAEVDPRRVRRQIEAMQRQAMKLQEQMQALQKMADRPSLETAADTKDGTPEVAKPAARVKEPRPMRQQLQRCGSHTSTAADEEECLGGFSRLTTGSGSPTHGFSRQTSMSSDDWEAGSASGKTDTSSVGRCSGGATSGSSGRDQVPGLFNLIVRNTFIDLEPSVPGRTSRRAHSMPAV